MPRRHNPTRRRRHLPTHRHHPHHPTERLTNIAIWTAALREPIDSAFPPALVPDTTRQSGATLTATRRLPTTPTDRTYLT